MEFGPLQRKWLRLLESGEYMQGKNALCQISYGNHYPDGICKFCCLGLAADQVLKIKPKKLLAYHYNHKIKEKHVSNSYQKEESFLSKEARRKLGLTIDGQQQLAQLNDNGKTFKAIAKEIKDNPEEYFYKSA